MKTSYTNVAFTLFHHTVTPKRSCLTHPKCLKGPPACDEVATIIQSPDAVVFDSLAVSEREGEGVLLTWAGSDEESAAGVAGKEQPFLCLRTSHIAKVPATKREMKEM